MPPGDRHPTGLEVRPAEPSTPALIRVGYISAPHGLGGALKVKPDDPASDTLHKASRVFVETAGVAREFRLASVSRLNRVTLRVELEGLHDPESAQALKGAIVMVAVADLPAVRPGEYYYFQVIGCEVSIRDGETIGAVTDVISTGANDVLVVRNGAHEVLVPVIEDVVKTMDLAKRRIIIEAVPGLLD
jgi:16S rRNA processing protein RimM